MVFQVVRKVGQDKKSTYLLEDKKKKPDYLVTNLIKEGSEEDILTSSEFKSRSQSNLDLSSSKFIQKD